RRRYGHAGAYDVRQNGARSRASAPALPSGSGQKANQWPCGTPSGFTVKKRRDAGTGTARPTGHNRSNSSILWPPRCASATPGTWNHAPNALHGKKGPKQHDGASLILRLFPTMDSHTRLRLRCQRMALYSFGLIWLGIVVGIELSIFDPQIPHLQIFATLYAANIGVYLLIRSGLSRRLRDPSLTVPQMVIASGAVTFILHYTSDIRGAMQSIYFMVMTFGVFALPRPRMFVMSLFILACYSGLIAYEWMAQPQAQIFGISFGLWLMLGLGLAWCVYVGGYIYNLQQRFREQRQALRDNEQRLTDINEQLYTAMTRLAEIEIRDELTGLFNRRHFLARLDEELARTERGGNHLHVALIDLDHFNDVNDMHGHQIRHLRLRKLADVAP